MGIGTLVSISVIRYMVSVFITLPMATVMKGHGMKAGSRVLACTLSEMVTRDVESGTVVL